MKIGTWNVNLIRQREGHVQRWLQRVQTDILVLQEIKCGERAVRRSTSTTSATRAI